jgi:hypothetical protein
MKFLKVIGILTGGVLAGIVAGLISFELLIPQNLSQPAYVDAANGFAMILFVVGGLIISVPLSILFAIWSWRKSTKNTNVQPIAR